MEKEFENVCQNVLKQITPSKSERAKIEGLAKRLEEKVAIIAKNLGVEAEMRVEGSVAKDTWLSEEPDIDIFIRLPTSVPRKSLGEIGLKIARKATAGAEQIERFAEHPYLEAIVNGVRVNIVPCYDTERGEWLSATDRTPYHTDYVKKRLKAQMRDEVRLLKKFMKGIEVYGAEIKVGGFSGYLCELLTLHFESFRKTLEAFALYKQRIIMDIEGYYEDRGDELKLLFKEPLVVVDPVDKGRNVASAVQQHKLYTFVAASRAFLEKPKREFFYPLETTALSEKKLKREFVKRGSSLLFLTFGGVNAVPDVLWGQLYRSQRSLRKFLQLNDFNVLRDSVWSDERKLNMFILELEQHLLPPIKKHLGPPLEREKECKNFLKKHLDNSETISGPYLEDGRWVVEQRRKHTDIVAFLSGRLRDGGRSVGVAEQIAQAMRKNFKIFVNDEVIEVYRKNDGFAKFLTEFLSGKPKWLEKT